MKYNKQFLHELHYHKDRIVYLKITLLSFNEQPIQEIQAIATGGSISLDGTSACRRVCSLNCDVVGLNKNEKIPIMFNSKFKLEIGLKNTIKNKYNQYDDIIWFNQGLFIVTNYTASYGEQKTTLSITAKDKACQLDGTIGGQFYAQTKLDTIEIEDSQGNIKQEKLTIKDIIYNLLIEYAHELPSNIIINDLDDYGYEQWTYRGTNPLYIIYRKENNVYTPYTATQSVLLLEALKGESGEVVLEVKPNDILNIEGATFVYIKLESGMTAGYHLTDLIYPSDLIANVGENIVTILNKIKDLLGTYEYFYDVNGKFIFQKTKQYIKDIKSLQKYNISYFNDLQFEDLVNSDYLIKTIQPAINTADIRNDFAVWGNREGVSGAKIPIHARVAIDLRPQTYNCIEVTEEDIERLRFLYPDHYPYEGNDYYLFNDSIKSFSVSDGYDYREILYQMALDYSRYHLLDDFYYRVERENPNMKNGITGYEIYYTDVLGFWRDLYDPERPLKYQFIQLTEDDIELNSEKIYCDKTTGKLLYCKNFDGYNSYIEKEYILAKNLNWQDYYSKIENQEDFEAIAKISYDEYSNMSEEEKLQFNDTFMKRYLITNAYVSIEQYNNDTFWNKNIEEDPSVINFWFELIEPSFGSDLEQFSISSIGDRPKFQNSKNNANIMLTEKVLEIQYQPTDETYKKGGGLDLALMQIPPNIRDMFVISSKSSSVLSEINELINKHTQMVNGANITMLPLYYLEPNTIIQLNNTTSGLVGNFNISKITLPLTYNGTMTLTTTKIIENLMEVE